MSDRRSSLILPQAESRKQAADDVGLFLQIRR